MRELLGRYIECRRAANQQASSREEEGSRVTLSATTYGLTSW